MKKEVIDRLVRDYFEGETSLREEAMLRNYFSQNYIADEYKDIAPLFCFFEKERLEDKQMQETSSFEQPVIDVRPRKKYIRFYLSLTIAASIALLFIVQMGNFNTNPSIEQSLVYVDGKRMLDINRINTEALHSIESISAVNEDVLGLQIDLIDTFTE